MHIAPLSLLGQHEVDSIALHSIASYKNYAFKQALLPVTVKITQRCVCVLWSVVEKLLRSFTWVKVEILLSQNIKKRLAVSSESSGAFLSCGVTGVQTELTIMDQLKYDLFSSSTDFVEQLVTCQVLCLVWCQCITKLSQPYNCCPLRDYILTILTCLGFITPI